MFQAAKATRCSLVKVTGGSKTMVVNVGQIFAIVCSRKRCFEFYSSYGSFQDLWLTQIGLLWACCVALTSLLETHALSSLCFFLLLSARLFLASNTQYFAAKHWSKLLFSSTRLKKAFGCCCISFRARFVSLNKRNWFLANEVCF